jgi:hypothetical protein
MMSFITMRLSDTRPKWRVPNQHAPEDHPTCIFQPDIKCQFKLKAFDWKIYHFCKLFII